MSSSSLTFEFPVRNSWPVGFGFRPTEEELITHYLHNKMLGNESLVQYIREVDLNNYEPHLLPKESVYESDNHEWFFFRAESDLHHNTNTNTNTNTKTKTKAKAKARTKRTTSTGYWKSTGEDKQIKARGTNKVIGYRKILVFHKGKTPNGVRTNWKIHEYRLHLQHTRLRYPYQRSLVVCRLKEDEDEVSTYDEDEQNNSASSRFKIRKVTGTEIQEVGHENNPTLTDLFNYVNFGDEFFDDVTSNNYGAFSKEEVDLANDMVHELQYGGFSSDTHNDAAFNLQVGHENNPTLTELFNYVDFEDELFDDVTSNNNGAFSKEEVDLANDMVHELQYGGFSGDTDNDAAFNLQNNDISPGWFNENVSFGGQMSTIKESRRSPLPVKRYQVKLKEEDVYESQGGLSSVSSGSGISMIIDDSDDEPTAFKPQCQQKLAKDLVPTSNRYKAKEDEKRIKVASPTSQLSITDSSNGRKSEAGNKYGCVGSKGRGFSCILTTKQIHHKSSVPLVYVAKAFLGSIMFFLFVKEMLLYGSWC